MSTWPQDPAPLTTAIKQSSVHQVLVPSSICLLSSGGKQASEASVRAITPSPSTHELPLLGLLLLDSPLALQHDVALPLLRRLHIFKSLTTAFSASRGMLNYTAPAAGLGSCQVG